MRTIRTLFVGSLAIAVAIAPQCCCCVLHAATRSSVATGARDAAPCCCCEAPVAGTTICPGAPCRTDGADHDTTCPCRGKSHRSAWQAGDATIAPLPSATSWHALFAWPGGRTGPGLGQTATAGSVTAGVRPPPLAGKALLRAACRWQV